jgi:hypothetical protein
VFGWDAENADFFLHQDATLAHAAPSELANDADLRKARFKQAGHPMDVR